MSKIVCTIKSIKTHHSLNVFMLDFEGFELKMISLEIDEKIKNAKKVIVGVKPFAVGILKDFHGNISFSNRLKGYICDIDNGSLLSSIKIKIGKTELESVMLYQTAEDMKLRIKDEITAVIRASELYIVDVCDV